MSSFDKKMHSTQKSMLKYAEELAANDGTTLDYSNKSIQKLDKLLGKIAKELREAGISRVEQFETDESAQGIAEIAGCYIVECIERNQQIGTWLEYDPQTGDKVYCFKTGQGAVIYPLDWVMKKLIDPRGYSLIATYKQWVLSLTA